MYQITEEDLNDFCRYYPFLVIIEFQIYQEACNRETLPAYEVLCHYTFWDEMHNRLFLLSLNLPNKNPWRTHFWCFNTPNDSFEQFLVAKYGEEMYEKYLTTYPTTVEENSMHAENTLSIHK